MSGKNLSWRNIAITLNDLAHDFSKKCKIPEGQRIVKVALRTARSEDSIFARDLYFETMRGMMERLFGWDRAREERNFAEFFKLTKFES